MAQQKCDEKGAKISRRVRKLNYVLQRIELV